MTPRAANHVTAWCRTVMAVAAVSSSWTSSQAVREWSSIPVCANAAPIVGSRWRLRGLPGVAADRFDRGPVDLVEPADPATTQHLPDRGGETGTRVAISSGPGR